MHKLISVEKEGGYSEIVVIAQLINVLDTLHIYYLIVADIEFFNADVT